VIGAVERERGCVSRERWAAVAQRARRSFESGRCMVKVGCGGMGNIMEEKRGSA
jgi:hypothetical protein